MTQTQDAPLASRLRDTVEHIREIAPPELFAVFGAEQQRLAATDDATGRIAVGDPLPRTALPDPSGHLVAARASGRP